ncbi:MAG: AbrB/MazE/SpoVT family DNA-binding domain-containing protein [Rhodothermales bacterium]
MMETTTLSSKGQVVIPKDVRVRHQWVPGQEFDVIETREGVLLRPRTGVPRTRIEDVGAALMYGGPRVSEDRLRIGDIPYTEPYTATGAAVDAAGGDEVDATGGDEADAAAGAEVDEAAGAEEESTEDDTDACD